MLDTTRRAEIGEAVEGQALRELLAVLDRVASAGLGVGYNLCRPSGLDEPRAGSAPPAAAPSDADDRGGDAIAMTKPNALITKSPDRLSGAAVFAGTRVPVQTLIEYLEAGDSLVAFLDDFPSVTREHAVAVLELAKSALLDRAETA